MEMDGMRVLVEAAIGVVLLAAAVIGFIGFLRSIFLDD